MLARYLAEHLEVRELRYRQAPVEFPEGWETYTYAFQLDQPEQLPQPFGGPLILRIYASPHGLPRARHEFAVQRHMLEVGYPVTAPLLLGENDDLFGGPFLVREQAPGCSLLQATARRPWRLWSAPAVMAAAQVRLHQLPADGFPSPPGSFLDRSLEEMAATCHRYDLPDLLPGLYWLRENRPACADGACIIHLDFHPMNLIDQERRPPTVLDWTEADVGDPHADVATSLMLMECVPENGRSLRDRVSVWAGRYFFTRWYLAAYREQRPLEAARLAYFRAWAALGRLCRCGRWLRGGPAVNGSKPSILDRLSARHLAMLERYFRKWTGVPCSLSVQPLLPRPVAPRPAWAGILGKPR